MTAEQALEDVVTRHNRLIVLLHRLLTQHSRTIQANERRVLALERALVERGHIEPEELARLQAAIAAQIEVDSALEAVEDELNGEIADYLRHNTTGGETPGRPA
jgi:hypothetical protein